jgi:restriction system protein
MQVRRGRWDRKPVERRYRDALSAIDWRDFERLIADYYRDQGFDIQHDGTGGRGVAFDGGVDIRLRKDGKLTLVQCKHENAFQTEHNAVNELLGIKVNEGADEAIVITSGEFTAAARKFGSQGHVRLIDGVELRRMLGSRLDALRPPAPSPLQTAAERLAWEAVDHIASGGGRRRGARAIEATFQAMLAKAALAVIGFLLFVFVGLPLLQKTLVSALTPPQTTRPVRQSVVPAPVPVPVSPPDYAAMPAAAPAPPMTAEELARAKQRQAERDAEVQRYLERVPEVTHYRYSPLDQNRDPPAQSSPPPPDSQ